MRVMIFTLLLVCCFSNSYPQFKIVMSEYKGYLANDSAADWGHYPTYGAYEQIMEKWARDYPQICKLYTLGPSERGRKILALKVSDNVNQKEAEPRFLQTVLLHGDEPLNLLYTLQAVDTILSTYGKDIRLTRLVDSIEFWFCPMMNPDAPARRPIGYPA